MAKVVFLSPSRTAFLYDCRPIMETPLSPLDFARRARRLYADREAVVDGILAVSPIVSSSSVVIAGPLRCNNLA
jgi:hypothetical protein